MALTQPVDWVGQAHEGYVMNTTFSPDNTATVMRLIREIESKYGDAVFCAPEAALHITLLDWIAPLVDYDSQNKAALFEQIHADYDAVFNKIFAGMGKIIVTFDQIHVSPSTIYITGHDDGSFQKIRTEFLRAVELLPGTKLPPTIIHSSLARFKKPIEIENVEKFLASQSINFAERVEGFRLVHTRKEPMLEFDVLKKYSFD